MRTLTSYRSLVVLWAIAAALCVSSLAYGVTPTRPLEVTTQFTPGAGLTGTLTVRVVAHKPAREGRISITAPASFTARFAKGEPQRDVKGDQVQYSLAVADRLDERGLSETIEISARDIDENESWPVEVHASARMEDGGTAIGHQSLIATTRGGNLLLQTPETFQRRLRTEAEVRAGAAIARDRGYNIEEILAGQVTKVDERSLPPGDDAQGDARMLQVTASPLNAWERATFVDRSRESEAELDPLTIRGRALFVDFDGVTRPLVNATIRVMDDDTGPDEHITSTITGWDGRFSTVVNNSDGWFQDGRDIYIRILTTNSRFRTEDCSYWPDWTYAWRSNDGSDLSDGTIVDFGSFTLAGATNSRRAAMVFQRLNSGWNHFTATGQQDPGFVDSCYPESPTVYDTFWGEVDIEGSDFDARDIIVHEWGHAIQDNAQFWNSWSGDAHTFCGLTSREQAFVEGWATFVALDVFPDNRFNWEPADTGQELEAYACAASLSTADGPRDEGRVVAKLLDVRDRTDDCRNGCGDTCDANSRTTVSLRTVWRDAMWGTIGILTDDAFEFWRELCPALTAAQRPPAVNIFDYSCIDVTACRMPSEVLQSPAGSPELAAGDVYPALSRLRDELRQTEGGRRLVDAFSRSATAMVELAESDARMRASLESLRKQVATLATWLTNERGEFEDRVPVTPETLAEFDTVAGGLRKGADAQVSANLGLTRLLLEELQGRSVAEIRGKLATGGGKK